MMHCDNMSIVQVLTSGTSKSEPLMDLVRKLFFLSAMYHFELSSCYINTHDNDVADALSRLQFSRFVSVAPDADLQMRMPVVVM